MKVTVRTPDLELLRGDLTSGIPANPRECPPRRKGAHQGAEIHLLTSTANHRIRNVSTQSMTGIPEPAFQVLQIPFLLHRPRIQFVSGSMLMSSVLVDFRSSPAKLHFISLVQVNPGFGTSCLAKLLMCSPLRLIRKGCLGAALICDCKHTNSTTVLLGHAVFCPAHSSLTRGRTGSRAIP